jgi:hypothetical protein
VRRVGEAALAGGIAGAVTAAGLAFVIGFAAFDIAAWAFGGTVFGALLGAITVGAETSEG